MYMSVASGPIALRVVSTTITIAVTLVRVRAYSCSVGSRARSRSCTSSSTGMPPVIVGSGPLVVGTGMPPVIVRGAGSRRRGWSASS